MVAFAPAGARLHAHALGRLAEALARYPEAALAYCDIVVADGEGREWPLAFPAFDYERMLEQGYCAFVFAARASHVRGGAEARRGRSVPAVQRRLRRGGPRRAPRRSMRRAFSPGSRPPTAPAPRRR